MNRFLVGDLAFICANQGMDKGCSAYQTTWYAGGLWKEPPARALGAAEEASGSPGQLALKVWFQHTVNNGVIFSQTKVRSYDHRLKCGVSDERQKSGSLLTDKSVVI